MGNIRIFTSGGEAATHVQSFAMITSDGVEVKADSFGLTVDGVQAEVDTNGIAGARLADLAVEFALDNSE